MHLLVSGSITCIQGMKVVWSTWPSASCPLCGTSGDHPSSRAHWPFQGYENKVGVFKFYCYVFFMFFFIVLDFSRVPGKIQIEWQSRWHKPFPKLCQFPALRSTPQSWLKMLLAVPGWLSDLPNATPGLRRLTSALSALELGPKIDAYWHS